jgi:hypothetical protein
MFCSHCESRIFDTDRTCPQCGAPTRNYIKVEMGEGKVPKRYLVSVAQVFFRNIDTLKVIADGIANMDNVFSYNQDFCDNKIYSSYHCMKLSVKVIMKNYVLSNSDLRVGSYYNLILLAKTIDKDDIKNTTYTQIEIPKLKILGMGISPKDKYIDEKEWLDRECVIDGIAELNKEVSCAGDYYAKVSNNLTKMPEFA